MPDETHMMFVRPRNCSYCGHGFHALGHVVQYAQSKGAWDITDMQGPQANKQPIYDAIDQTDPGSFYGFGHGCYSEDTKILTEEGWKYFWELTNEKVATLNKKDELEYQKPTRHIFYEYNGKMFFQKGGAIDLLVTPDHNLLVSWQVNQGKEVTPYKFLKPSQLKDAHTKDKQGNFIKNRETTTGRLRFKRNVKWVGTDQQLFTLPEITYDYKNQYSDTIYKKNIPEKKIKMEDWLEFFGWWLAEGCACLGYADKEKKYINYRISITQNNDEKREEIKECIERLGYSYRESGNDHSINIEIRNKQLYIYLKQFGHAKDKFIPKEIKQLPIHLLRILFDSMIKGDGSNYGTHLKYSTSSEKLMNDFQEICLKIGYASSEKKYKDNVYNINISTKNNLEPLCLKQKRGWREYSGNVCCVEVPNHIIYVKRNGKACWCGNSETTFTADSEQMVFSVDENSKLSGRIVYLLSCLTANSLGPAIIENGATAYAGYDISWTWLSDSDPDGDNDPYDDPYALCFWESANELWMALLDGESFDNAMKSAVAKYNEWIDYWMYTNPDDEYAEDCIMWLAHDRNGLVGYEAGDVILPGQGLSLAAVPIIAVACIALFAYKS